jgi:SSS family solute:Na+ symporter
MAYPALAEIVLPNFWKGIFIVTLLATIMSTLNSYAFLSASTISNDILLKFKILSKFSITYLTRLSLIITSVLGILLALLLPSPIEIVFRTASIAVPGLILPLTLSFFLRIRISNSMVTVIMCSSSLVSLALFLVQSSDFCPNILKELEPMLAGLIVSIMLTLPSLRIRH